MAASRERDRPPAVERLTMDPELIAQAQALLDLCRRKQLKIAAAESAPAGSGRGPYRDPGSSDVLERGFVTYSNEAKQVMLGVLRRCSNVTARSAGNRRSHGQGAVAHAPVDLAVSITGIAGPGGATAGARSGSFDFAAASRDGRLIQRSRIRRRRPRAGAPSVGPRGAGDAGRTGRAGVAGRAEPAQHSSGGLDGHHVRSCFAEGLGHHGSRRIVTPICRERIPHCLGGCLLGDYLLGIRPFFDDFYGEAGILPLSRSAVGPGLLIAATISRLLDALGLRSCCRISTLALFTFASAIALAVECGRAAFNSYLYWRNVYVVSGAEDLARLLLIWCLFLPLNRYWSVDAALDPQSRERPYPVPLFVALRLQIVSLYVFSGLFKLAGARWLDAPPSPWC